MKKVLVLTAVVCLMASMSQATILQAWLTADVVTTSPQDYTVSIWVKELPDPALGETVQSMIDNIYCFSDITATIYTSTSPTTKITQPNKFSALYPNDVATTFNPAIWDLNDGHGALQDYHNSDATTGPVVAADGILDCVQTVASTDGAIPTLGINQTVLMCTQVWHMYAFQPVTLHLVMGTSSRHFDLNSAFGVRDPYSIIETGSLVNGVFVTGTTAIPVDNNIASNTPGWFPTVWFDGPDLVIAAPTPEPATLALLGFGAVATLLRRRNKK